MRFVEDFETADSVAFERQKVNLSPFGIEALWRGGINRPTDDRPDIAEPMHGLDVDVDVRRDIPRCADIRAS